MGDSSRMDKWATEMLLAFAYDGIAIVRLYKHLFIYNTAQ